MSFQPWDAAKSGIVLPIQGVEYTIAPLGHLDAIRVRAAMTESTAALAEKRTPDPTLVLDNETFLAVTLGDNLAAMRKANVPDIAVIHAAAVAHTFNFQGREAAEKQWAEGLDPEALAASMKAAQERMASPKASRRSPSTASGNRTRKASTTATSSRPAKTRPASGSKRSRAAGRPSSPAAD